MVFGIPNWILNRPEVKNIDPPNTNNKSDVILWSIEGAKHIYHNCMTGAHSCDLSKVLRYQTRNIYFYKYALSLKGYYLRKISDDLIALEIYTFNNKSHKLEEGDKLDWEYCTRGFISKNGTSYINNRDFLRSTYVDMCQEEGKNIYLVDKAIHKYTGTILADFLGTKLCYDKDSGNILGYIDVFHHHFMRTFLKYQSAAEIKDEKKNLIDIPLSNDWITTQRKSLILKMYRKVLSYQQSFSNIYTMNQSDYLSFSVVQRVNDKTCVIRAFKVSADISKIESNLYDEQFKKMSDDNLWEYTFMEEYFRVYATDKKVFVCRRGFGKWHIVKAEKHPSSIFQHINLGWEKSDVEGTKLSYMEDLRKEINTLIEKIQSDDYNTQLYNEICDKNVTVCNCLLYPAFEQLQKSKYRHLAWHIHRWSTKDCPEVLLQLSFGIKLNNKKNNFFKDCKVPISIFQEIEEGIKKTIDDSSYVDIAFVRTMVKNIKDCFGEDNKNYLERMNNEQAGKFAKMLIWFNGYNCIEILTFLIKSHGPQNCISYLEFLEEMRRDMNNCNRTHSFYSFSTIYLDYLRMINNLDNLFHNEPWKFDSADDMIIAHDQISAIYNRISDKKRYEVLSSKFDFQKKKWDKLLYTEKDFSVIAPKEVSDIAEEGIKLRHCVKTYIDSVCDGNTIIMFIRKTNDIRTPFYTLEVKNNEVRQCHGLMNRNTSEVKGLDAFLLRYCKAVNIKYNKGERVLAVV